VTGLVVPLAWLTLGTIVYGVEAIDVVDPAHATVPGTTPADRATRVVDRFNRTLGDRGARRAWELMLDPGRRFGGLVGALGMLWRSRWGAVLLFCVAFALLTLGEQVVLTVAQAVVGQPGIVAWRALVDPLGIVSTVVVQVLTTALLAAAADALLANLGLPSALRTRRSARARAAASVVCRGRVGGAGPPGDERRRDDVPDLRVGQGVVARELHDPGGGLRHRGSRQRGGGRRHEGPHAATGRHEPRGLEVPVRARDRPRRDAEVVRERAHGRQPLTVRQVARRDEGRDLRPEL